MLANQVSIFFLCLLLFMADIINIIYIEIKKAGNLCIEL